MRKFKVFPNGSKFMILVEKTPGCFDYLPGNGVALYTEERAKAIAEAMNREEIEKVRNESWRKLEIILDKHCHLQYN